MTIKRLQRLQSIKRAITTQQYSLHLQLQQSALHTCLMCAQPSPRRLCVACEAYWPLNNTCCQCCALPLNQRSLKCGQCLKKPPSYDATYAPYLYQAPLNTLLLRFKNHRDFTLGKALGEYWCRGLQQLYQAQHWILPDTIAPVPLHWQQQWRRGFNQSHFFSAQLSQYFAIPEFVDSKRVRPTKSQKTLSKKQRLHNLKDAFKINRSLTGKTVAIVDDVMTTGATAEVFAKALKQAGAEKVVIWILARTPPPHY